MPKRKRPTAKQRKLIEKLPDIISGKKTKKDAMMEAGYSEKTATSGTEEIFCSDTIKTPMQKALEKAGVTIDIVGQKISEGLDATERGVIPDFATRHKYVVTAAELHDVFPSKKLDHMSGGKPIKGITVSYE